MDETPLHEKSLAQLQHNRSVAILFIQIVSQTDDKDPRKAEALAYYQDQLAQIETEIKIKETQPGDVVVGLHSASLTGSVQ